MNEIKLKNCPFCGSNKIGYSIKTCGSYRGQYHVAMYCKDCNCYGKRTLIKLTEEEYRRYDVENNKEYKELAIQAWNTRKPIEYALEKISYNIESSQNGANDIEVAYWNNALRTSIRIVKECAE